MPRLPSVPASQVSTLGSLMEWSEEERCRSAVETAADRICERGERVVHRRSASQDLETFVLLGSGSDRNGGRDGALVFAVWGAHAGAGARLLVCLLARFVRACAACMCASSCALAVGALPLSVRASA
eukprot:6175325-Pleurochrysis_carterae.AAC.1